MSYVTGCHLVVKLETNEIYHRREQPPWLTSMATRTVKNRSLRGGLWHRLREEAGREGMKGVVDRLHFWEAWNCDDYVSSPGRELFALECIAPLGGRNSPRGTIYRVSWWTWEVATGRVPCENERERKRERERLPEDRASFRFFLSILFSVFVDVNIEEKRRDGRRMDRASSVIFVGREDIIAVLVSVKTYRVRGTDVGRVWLKVAFLFRFDFVFFLSFFLFSFFWCFLFNCINYTDLIWKNFPRKFDLVFFVLETNFIGKFIYFCKMRDIMILGHKIYCIW